MHNKHLVVCNCLFYVAYDLFKLILVSEQYHMGNDHIYAFIGIFFT